MLINGGGHIYHQGEEGTNKSLAYAHVIAHQVGLDWMTTTSDVTEAYRLAGHPVNRVTRTLVLLKPDVLAVFDAVDLEAPSTVEVRFQAFNRDGKGDVVAENQGFRIKRPHAGLVAVVGGVQPTGESPASIRWSASDGQWLIEGERNGQPFEVRLVERANHGAPAVTVLS